MDAFTTEIAKFGLPGLFILALAVAVRTLFVKYDEVQNKRVEEARETIEVIRANTISQDKNTEAVRALGDVVRGSRRS